MRIGYFLGDADVSGGGTGPYAWRFLELLLSSSTKYDVNIVIICSRETRNDCFELIRKYQLQLSVSVRLIPKNLNLLEFIPRLLELVFARVLPKLGIDKRLDLFFSPRYRWFSSLPIDLLHFPCQTPYLYDLPYPFVVTMHDVQELHYPEFFTPEDRSFRAKYYLNSLKSASSVIVSFNHVKLDLIKYFNLSEARVFVCPLPYKHIKLNSPAEQQAVKYAEKYASLDSFILYPAKTWQHKNHLCLIKAIEMIKNRYDHSVHLVCTGQKTSFYYDAIKPYLDTSPVTNQFHFTGVLAETELFWLYNKCALVVIPTMYEAGSFPLLEAMYLDVPVICSSVTSLPETIGDLRFVFDPLDVDGMSQLIYRMLAGDELCAINKMNSRARVKQLLQVDSSQLIYNVWCSLVRH